MENELQREAFLSYEANAWFERNKTVFKNYKKEDDLIVNLMKRYKLNSGAVLEIGCSAGYRLNGIKETFKDCSVYGIEPSLKAIEYGKQQYPDVNFFHGTADNLRVIPSNSIDAVIVGFVFYVVDRTVLFTTFAEIDRVLKNGGTLIIIDFFSEAALKNSYQHIKEFSAYSFKQNYDEVFTASKLYYLLDKSTWSHSEKTLDASDNYHDKYCISLLKKDLSASYK